MPVPMSREFADLLAALVDGRLDAAGEARLGELLRDPAGRRAYLRYCDLHADLAERFSAAEPAPVPVPQPPPARHLLRGALWATAGLAAALLVAATLALWTAKDSQPPLGPARQVATVVAGEAARWADGQPAAAGDPVRHGPFHLVEGSVTARTLGGAELKLLAPIQGEWVNETFVRVNAGRVAARMPESAIGFRLATPAADVVDMGTEFGVQVEPSGAFEVHVFKGVVVARPRGSNSVVSLHANEAGRLEPEQADLVSIPMDAAPFDRPADPPPPDPPVAAGERLPPGSRLVVVGDRVLDHETVLLLFAQAVAEAKLPDVPRLYNATGSIWVHFPEASVEKYLRPLRPTHVLVAFGAEVASLNPRATSPAAFEKHLRRGLDLIRGMNAVPILLTVYPFHPAFVEAAETVQQYNQVIRRLAEEQRVRFIDVEPRFRRAVGEPLTRPELFVPTFAGHREIAASLLEGLGYGQIAVPRTLHVEPLPGLVNEWQYRLKPARQRLTAEEVTRLQPGEGWTTLTLPMDDKLVRRMPEWCHSTTRQHQARGYAYPVHFHKDRDMEAVAYIDSPRERQVYLNTGIRLYTVWVNGQKVYDNPKWSGWHAGKERVPVTLKPGRNKVVIEAHDAFFVSFTESSDWSLTAP